MGSGLYLCFGFISAKRKKACGFPTAAELLYCRTDSRELADGGYEEKKKKKKKTNYFPSRLEKKKKKIKLNGGGRKGKKEPLKVGPDTRRSKQVESAVTSHQKMEFLRKSLFCALTLVLD